MAYIDITVHLDVEGQGDATLKLANLPVVTAPGESYVNVITSQNVADAVGTLTRSANILCPGVGRKGITVTVR